MPAPSNIRCDKMADKIRIIGGNPSVDLELAGFDGRLVRPSMAHWSSFETGDFTFSGSRIIAVAPRAGEGGLIKSADSIGPIPASRGGLPVAKHANAVLDYLYAAPTVDGSSVTVGAIVYLDNSPAAGGNDLIGMFQTGNGKKLWIWNGRWQVRDGATTLVSSAVYPHTGWYMVLWSQFGGSCAMSIERIGQAPQTFRAASLTNTGAASNIVFGADEVANGNPGATPIASRAWGDCIADTFIWRGVDILSESELEYRAILSDYFNTVYGDAA